MTNSIQMSEVESYDEGNRQYLSVEEYSIFNEAFIWFNTDLFDGELEPCLITLNNRNHRSRGFYSHEKFSSREAPADRVAEIALNPDTFVGRDDMGILSTLVHEMVHLWQYQLGNPGSGRYHNLEWAGAMESIGLMPSHTGEPGGKRTGSQMTHYILSGGPFEQSANAFLAKNHLKWQSNRTNDKQRKRKAASKTKYHCTGCGQNAWAKPETKLICGACHVEMLDQRIQSYNRGDR